MLSEKPLIERLDTVKEGFTVLQHLLKGNKTQLIKSSNILLNPHTKNHYHTLIPLAQNKQSP